MAAADNPYFIQPANPLQSLMTGFQAYESADKRRKENELEAAYKQLGPQIQQGGLDNSALAKLFALGPAGAPMLTAAGHFATAQETMRHNRVNEDQAAANATEGKSGVHMVPDPVTGSSKLVRYGPGGTEVLWDSLSSGRGQPPQPPGPQAVAPQAPQAVVPPPTRAPDVTVGPPLNPNKTQAQVPALPPGAPMSGAPAEPGSELPAGARPISTNPRNEQALAEIERSYGPQTRSAVEALLDYRTSPKNMSIVGGHREFLTGLATKVDPTYDEKDFPLIAKARADYGPGGQSSKGIRSLNVAFDHLGTFEDLVGALKNGNVQVINSVKNRFQEQFGATAPTNVNAAKQILGAEIIKAIVQNGGGVTERQAAEKAIGDANSYDQLMGVSQTYKKLLAGQLEGHRRSYEVGTKKNDFDKFLSEPVLQFQRHLREDTGSKTEGTTANGTKWRIIPQQNAPQRPDPNSL